MVLSICRSIVGVHGGWLFRPAGLSGERAVAEKEPNLTAQPDNGTALRQQDVRGQAINDGAICFLTKSFNSTVQRYRSSPGN
jgi:hypothetical protein